MHVDVDERVLKGFNQQTKDEYAKASKLFIDDNYINYIHLGLKSVKLEAVNIIR